MRQPPAARARDLPPLGDPRRGIGAGGRAGVAVALGNNAGYKAVGAPLHTVDGILREGYIVVPTLDRLGERRAPAAASGSRPAPRAGGAEAGVLPFLCSPSPTSAKA